MILVTGAGGFIGGYVCRRLKQQGQDVIALDRRFRTSLPCRMAEGDVSNPDFLRELFQAQRFDAVVHLAGLLNAASRRQPEAALRVNMGGSLSLLQLTAQFETPKFIFGSSISVYGAKSFAACGEVAETEPAAPASVYGVAKRFVEIAGEELRQQCRLQFCALRISMTVGAGAAQTSSPWRSEIFEKLTVKERTVIRLPFAREEIVPLVHADDVAAMAQQLVTTERAKHAIYNTPSENRKCGELADYLRALNRNLEFAFEPAGARDAPEAVSGRRFAEEFEFNAAPLKERLDAVCH
jgi:nucleoside-diphosphate-sugar epimerase